MPGRAVGPGRRHLLALPAAAAAGPAAAQAYGAARDSLAGLRLGANLERWFPISRDHRPRRLGPGWWRDFRAAGFDHVRMFLPEFGQTGAGLEVPGHFAQAVEDAVAAGLPVLLGMADFYRQDSPGRPGTGPRCAPAPSISRPGRTPPGWCWRR